jgi:hypothetical protein
LEYLSIIWGWLDQHFRPVIALIASIFAVFFAWRKIGNKVNDLDDWLKFYNTERTHQGKMCCGRTPLETLLDGKWIWAEKNLAQI